MRLLLPLFGLAILLSACSATPKNAGPQKIALIGPDQKAIQLTVEVADSPDEWSKGLSDREDPLAPNTGMLFLFPQQEVLSFWMKDTYHPLDIIFFDTLGKVVHSTTMTPCEADPCATYTSEKPASIALEVPAGFVESQGIVEGWQLALPTSN